MKFGVFFRNFLRFYQQKKHNFDNNNLKFGIVVTYIKYNNVLKFCKDKLFIFLVEKILVFGFCYDF